MMKSYRVIDTYRGDGMPMAKLVCYLTNSGYLTIVKFVDDKPIWTQGFTQYQATILHEWLGEVLGKTTSTR